MKKYATLIFLVSAVTLVAALFVFVGVHTEHEKKRVESAVRYTDSLYSRAQADVESMNLDSATKCLNQITKLSQEKGSFRVTDSAKTLYGEIKNFAIRQKEESFKGFLTTMTNDEYRSLCKNELSKVYFKNEKLNQEFINILYLNRLNRVRYLAEAATMRRKIEQEHKEMRRKAEIERRKIEQEQKEMRRKAEIERKRKAQEFEAASTLSRKEYGAKLRENYLDKNMDIKVYVYGKNNTMLKLSFVLFNDVWTHKMQKGSLINEIRDMGFKRFALTNGYDYSVYWTF